MLLYKVTVLQQAEDHSAATLVLKQDLDDARAVQARERDSRRKDNDEVRQLRERCERLESERDEFQGTQVLLRAFLQFMMMWLIPSCVAKRGTNGATSLRPRKRLS